MKRIITLLGALVIGSSVTAQEFHGGLSLDYAKPHSGDSQTSVTFMGGVMLGGPVFKYGIEAEAGLPLGGNTDYDVARLRLLGSYDLGNYTVLAGAGVAEYDTPGGTVDGDSLSLGLQRAISDRVTLRAEFVRDFMDDGVPDTTTTRVGMIYNFY